MTIGETETSQTGKITTIRITPLLRIKIQGSIPLKQPTILSKIYLKLYLSYQVGQTINDVVVVKFRFGDIRNLNEAAPTLKKRKYSVYTN